MNEQKTYINIIVTDMGNGGAFCGSCGCDLDHGDPRNTVPPSCPKCHKVFEGTSGPINFGGSDF